jgi:hypothetical protein
MRPLDLQTWLRAEKALSLFYFDRNQRRNTMKHVKHNKRGGRKGKAHKGLKIHGGFKATEHKANRKR